MNRYHQLDAGLGRFCVIIKSPDWLGLGEASRLLGVAPGTLRRWSDSGQVTTFTTPGGHRRFRRSVLERLLPGPPDHRPSLLRSGLTAARVARAYRGKARVAVGRIPWLLALDDDHRAWFRTHGRMLAQHLLSHLDARDVDDSSAALRAAIEEATAYGRMAAELEVSLSDAVEGFLEFRRPFLHELGLVARQRGFDTAAATALMEDAERAMDGLLVASMMGHRGIGSADTP
jgi:excisionase family DNA binding protein